MASETCNKCGEALDTTGYPLWCLKCRAKDKRDRDANNKERRESQCWAQGVAAMREYLAQQFSSYGTQGSFSGIEIARVIAHCRGPE